MVKRNTISKRLLSPWLELTRLVRERKYFQSLLYDRVTGLPTPPLFLKEIEKILNKRKWLGLLCIDIIEYEQIERIYGWETFDKIMREISGCLSTLPSRCLRENDIVLEPMINGNAFIVILSPPRTKGLIEEEDLTKIKRRVSYYIHTKLTKKFPSLVFHKFSCHIGSAILERGGGERTERLIYQGIKQALENSYVVQRTKEVQKKAVRLKNIVEEEDIRILFQPIVALDSRNIFGYEALCRGPFGGELEKPHKLFEFAYDTDFVLELDRLCRKKALEASKNMNLEQLLFINVEPESIEDPELEQLAKSDFLSEVNLGPERIVLEITEHAGVFDFGIFCRKVELLRSLGFRISIDDAGSGHAGLQLLAETKPDFIKIDASFVRGISKNSTKQELLKMFSMFTRYIGATLVAEGVETISELKALLRLGIRYGQGYLFACPSDSFTRKEFVERF